MQEPANNNAGLWLMVSTTFGPACRLLLSATIALGVVYPCVVFAAAQVLFAHKANGSLVMRDGTPVGSRLIGQDFHNERYFWSRPSATATAPYNAMSSGGSNLSPTHPQLHAQVAQRVQHWREAHPAQTTGPVPVDAVTTSASGLDPHVSPATAAFQVERVAAARQLPVPDVQALVQRHTEPRTLGVLGEPRVNVLLLNLALDQHEQAR